MADKILDGLDKICVAIGARVEGGEGDDYDTGTVREHLAGAQVLVAWDSGVTTPAPASILTVI